MKFLFACFVAFLVLLVHSLCVVSGKCAREEKQVILDTMDNHDFL